MPDSEHSEQPSHFAEPEPAAPAAVAPSESLAPAVVLRPGAAAIAPGWYPEAGSPGVLRYWNGRAWEDWRRPLVEAPTVDQGQKQVGVAYLLAIFLGGLGIYNFYLGRTGPAIAMLVLWLIAFPALFAFGVGGLIYLALGVWVLIDLFLIPGYVRTANLRALQPR